MNRLFTKLVWAVAAVLTCVVFAVLTSTRHPAVAHAAHPPNVATGPARAAAAGRSAVSPR